MFNLIPGIISLIALYKGVMALIGKSVYANASVIALSCCYQWIYYVQECAEYCLMLMFLFLSLLFWIRLMKENRIRDYLFFVINIVCAIFSQYGAAIIGIPYLGIAFFTFQGMSYTIDVYRGSVKAQENPFKVDLYITLFSQLIA